MVFVSCQFYLALFTVNSGSLSIFQSTCLFLNFSENLGIFRVALLFICQRSKPLALQELCVSLLFFSAATLISYHNRFRLSTTVLNFFRLEKLLFFATFVILAHLVGICQQLFLKSFPVSFKLSYRFSRCCLNNEIEYIILCDTCQHYFSSFSNNFV